MGEPDPVKNFFAGTAAGIVQVLVGQPFDTGFSFNFSFSFLII